MNGVFDIETQDWTRFVCGGMYGIGINYQYKESWNEERFADWLLTQTGTWYAHNGGRFDFYWLLDKADRQRKMKCEPIVAGNRIVKLTIGELVLQDSAAIFPMSLRKLTDGEKDTTGLPCCCEGPDCGGYCSISRSMPESWRLRLSRYLERDCVSLHDALSRFFDYARSNGLSIKATIGASAWDFAKRYCELPAAKWESIHYHFARDAYYGGRTEVYKPYSDSGLGYDINSAYPAALTRLSLPVGTMREVTGKAVAPLIESELEGIARVTLDIPDCHAPPLPMRNKHGRVCYPVGLISGTWTLLEIRHAIDCGAVVHYADKALVWDSTEAIVAPSTAHLWKLRDAAGKKSALGGWLKLYANSLSGKFAQSPELEAFMICDESQIPDKKRFCQDRRDCFGYNRCALKGYDGCCIHHCAGFCGAFKPFGLADKSHRVWTRSYFMIGASAHIHFAAYLTSWARVTLHRAIVSSGRGMCYCDTDSVFRESVLTDNVGKGLGQFDLQCRYRYLDALAPKVYSYVDADTGEVIARAKGVPDAARNFDRLETGVLNDRGVLGFKSAAREVIKGGSWFSRKRIERKIVAPTDIVGSRRIVGNNTEPLHWKECEELD